MFISDIERPVGWPHLPATKLSLTQRARRILQSKSMKKKQTTSTPHKALKTRHSAAITCNYTIQDFPFWKLQRYIMPNGKIKDSRAIFGRSCHILSWGTNYYWSGPAIILSPWTKIYYGCNILSPISCLDKICPPLLCLDKIFLPYILCPDKICLPYCALTHSDQNFGS